MVKVDDKITKKSSNKKSGLSMERIFGLFILLPFLALGLYYLVDKLLLPSLPPDQTIEALKLDELQSYDDLIIDENKQPVGFFLGEFDDISDFSSVAQKDFKHGIRYYIYPSKNCKSIAVIKIPQTTCSNTVAGFSEEMMNDRDFDTNNNVAYGPIIYRNGETWKIWGSKPKENKYTGGWQPMCYHNNVKLTPEAEAKAKVLLKFLRDMNNMKYSDGKFDKGNGSFLTELEQEIAIGFGMIDTKREFMFFTKPIGISEKYKTVQRYLNSKEQ